MRTTSDDPATSSPLSTSSAVECESPLFKYN